MSKAPEAQPENPLYETIRSYVFDGTPIDNNSILEFARDGRPFLIELGKSGIALTDRDRGDRFRKLWDSIDKHGEAVPRSYEGLDTDKTHKSHKNLYG